MKKCWLIATLVAGLAYSQTDERAVRWHQDFEALSAGLKATGFRIAGGIASRGQKDFALLYPNFDREIQSIEADVPHLTDAEVLLRLMHLMASAHVAHNTIQTPAGMGFLNRLPVDFVWFPDGFAVFAATSEHKDALGARVVKIGDLTPESLLSQLEPYISYENTAELHRGATELMNARGVLEHLNLIGDDGSVSLQLEKPDGQLLKLALPLADARVQKTNLAEGLPMPLYRSHPGVYYWHQYLEDSQSLFISYNRCANDPKRRFDEFARQVLADADAHAVKRVVIDLRWNGGGNSAVMGPLISGLKSRLKSVGQVYVLIGPSTFSSAVDNAVELQKSVSAKLVGMPSGGMPGGYGEVAKLTLPNSKLVIRYTTKNFGTVAKGGAKTLIPDIQAPLRIADFLAGRDPVLEAAIHAN